MARGEIDAADGCFRRLNKQYRVAAWRYKYLLLFLERDVQLAWHFHQSPSSVERHTSLIYH